MNSKILISVFSISLFCLGPAIQAQDLEEEVVEEEPERYAVALELDVGGQIVDTDSNSSKFNEYRDNDTDALINRVYLSIDDTETGRYLDFRGRRLSRDDQDLFLDLGLSDMWRLDFDYNATPHLLSNSARTPYDYLGNGRYRVAGGIVDDIQISTINNAATWTAPNAGPGGPGEDARIALVLHDAVHHIDLGTQRDTSTVGLDFYLTDRTKARFEFQYDDKGGSILTGVALGDRPPRSLVTQLPEPVDYKTYNFKVAFEHYADSYTVDASYKYSAFENDVDTMTWNSLFHAADFYCTSLALVCAGAGDYDALRHRAGRDPDTLYSTTGALALNPDNTYHNFTFNGGIRLPWWNSRLSGSFVYTNMEQDEALLPYATSDFGGAVPALTRPTAQAEIDTTMVKLAYNVSPVRRLNLNLQYRYYDMDNDTPEATWLGTTQDSNPYPYRSERINIAYDLEQQNIGADLTYYLGKAGTLGFAYENEQIDRPNREVTETDEDRFTFSYRVAPVNWGTLRAEYTLSDRDGNGYNGEITDQSYAYDTIANAGQFDNPVLGFANNPGLRKFDVTDRDQDEFELDLNLMPIEGLNINLSYDYINNDYGTTIADSINTWDAIALTFVNAFVDPTQLGLLDDETNRYAVELNYAPNEALNVYGYYSREEMDSNQRGRYVNENNRIDNITGNKDWQRTTGEDIWDAAISDETDTFAFGASYKAMEDKLKLSADFSHSNGEVGINYTPGSNLVEDDTTSIHDHAEWASPPDVEFESNVLNLGITYALSEKLTLGFNYTFEDYTVTDWMQDGNSAHKLVYSENFVAEIDGETAGTGNDRGGSRLVRLDDYLAPDYEAHWGIFSIQYKW